MTRDHSVVEELVRNGLLQRDQASHHPDANVLTRAVGGADDLALERVSAEVAPGDVFLLCSDGLTKELADDEIAEVLATTELRRATEELVARALARGGHDNVTVVVAQARRV